MDNKRFVFLDYVRIVACFLVVLYHSRYEIYQNAQISGGLNNFDRFSLNVSFVIGRLAVPLFFIITGYLTIPIKDNIFCFLKNRIMRLIFPLLIWNFIYTVSFSSYSHYLNDFINLNQSPQLWYLYAL